MKKHNRYWLGAGQAMRMVVAVVAALCGIDVCYAAETLPEGAWEGKLQVSPQVSLRLVFNINNTDSKPTVTIDSPDQNAYGIPTVVNHLSADSLSVSVSQLKMSYVAGLHDGQFVGQFHQGALSLPLTLSPGKQEVKRPQTPKPPYTYTYRDLYIKNEAGNSMLAGTLTLPKDFNPKKTPVVVMISGSGQQNRDEELFDHKPFAVIADRLAKAGIASFRYDDRGAGMSKGDINNATTADYASDARAIMNYLRDKEGMRKVGLLGHSEGASIAFILGASDKKKAPAFIVTVGAPATRGDSILIDQNRVLLQASGIPEPIIDKYLSALGAMYEAKISEGRDASMKLAMDLTAGWTDDSTLAPLGENLKTIAADKNVWLNYFISYSPAEDILKTKCPVFVAYGDKDTQVTSKLNEPIMRRLSPKSKIMVYPGLNHLMQHCTTGLVMEYGQIEETFAPEVMDDIVEFIMKNS